MYVTSCDLHVYCFVRPTVLLPPCKLTFEPDGLLFSKLTKSPFIFAIEFVGVLVLMSWKDCDVGNCTMLCLEVAQRQAPEQTHVVASLVHAARFIFRAGAGAGAAAGAGDNSVKKV